MTSMPNRLKDTELKRLKEQGRAFLKSNQIDKALRIYARILQENPNDLDSLLILGDSYFVSGEREEALALYSQAYQLAPGRKDVERRLFLVKKRGKEEIADAEHLPTDPQAITGLLQKLTGRLTPINDVEVSEAENLLTDFLRSNSPGQAVAEHLDEIDSLLPALIELNIRQARADGRVDLVKMLEDLMANVLIQMDSQPDPDEIGEDSSLQITGGSSKRILVAGVNSQHCPFRKALTIKAFRSLGYEVVVDHESTTQDWNNYQLVVAHNPHVDSRLVKGLAVRAGAGLPNLLDFDLDFHSLPQNHPDQEILGINQTEAARNFTVVLQLANRITVPCAATAADFERMGYPVEVIPEGWDEDNTLWNRPAPNRSMLNMGLIVLPGQLDDVTQIRRSIVRVVREFQALRLVIGGDPIIYQHFDNIPEVRRLFLPPADMEDYPYMIAQLDLALVPLLGNAFNLQQTDRKLMEAGVRRIPWIASPFPAAIEWGSGGLIANTQEEWHAQMRLLIMDGNLRKGLGKAGRQKAMQREIKTIAKYWLPVIRDMLKVRKLKRP